MAEFSCSGNLSTSQHTHALLPSFILNITERHSNYGTCIVTIRSVFVWLRTGFYAKTHTYTNRYFVVVLFFFSLHVSKKERKIKRRQETHTHTHKHVSSERKRKKGEGGGYEIIYTRVADRTPEVNKLTHDKATRFHRLFLSFTCPFFFLEREKRKRINDATRLVSI